MSDISAKLVMQLRNKTGLSMMECKKALVETSGDIDAAEESLRKKLKGKMDTRVDRAAGEGCIAVAAEGDAAAIVELRCETDFTAKNDTFRDTAKEIATMCLGHADGDIGDNDDIKKIVDELRIKTGENVSVGRAHKASGGGFSSYIHHDHKTGVLLHLTDSIPDDLGKQICMHVTAAVPRPQGVTRDDVPESVIEKERKIAMDMARESGKNEEIAAKMVEGKINKLYSELALLEQIYVVDNKTKVGDLLPSGVGVNSFQRWEVGESAE